MNQISPFTSIIKEAWCVCGVSSIKFKKKRFDHPREGQKIHEREKKKKKKRSQSSSKKSLSRERVREREDDWSRGARPRRDDDEKEELLAFCFIAARFFFLRGESSLGGFESV